MTEEQTAAVLWGRALKTEMTRRSMTVNELAARVRCQKATISDYRRGNSLPLVSRASDIAEALAAPRLLELCVELRTVKCEDCERTFVRNQRGGTQRRWCSYACKDRYRKRVLYTAERHWTGKRYDTWQRMARKLSEHVTAMCRSCEPGGICRQDDCALREVSPLPLVARRTA